MRLAVELQRRIAPLLDGLGRGFVESGSERSTRTC